MNVQMDVKFEAFLVQAGVLFFSITKEGFREIEKREPYAYEHDVKRKGRYLVPALDLFGPRNLLHNNKIVCRITVMGEDDENVDDKSKNNVQTTPSR